MKEQYLEPQMDVVVFPDVDVIATSDVPPASMWQPSDVPDPWEDSFWE